MAERALGRREQSQRAGAACREALEYRGVSSTVKLSVSKTELGGSNPSAPARFEAARADEQQQKDEVRNGSEPFPQRRVLWRRQSQYRRRIACRKALAG